MSGSQPKESQRGLRLVRWKAAKSLERDGYVFIVGSIAAIITPKGRHLLAGNEQPKKPDKKPPPSPARIAKRRAPRSHAHLLWERRPSPRGIWQKARHFSKTHGKGRRLNPRRCSLRRARRLLASVEKGNFGNRGEPKKPKLYYPFQIGPPFPKSLDEGLRVPAT